MLLALLLLWLVVVPATAERPAAVGKHRSAPGWPLALLEVEQRERNAVQHATVGNPRPGWV
eukprot:10286872-Alexandrium_andersonii.AAC.1